MKVTGNIVQLKVTGSMSQLKVVGTISQLEVSGNIVQGGFDWIRYWAGLISATVENAAPTKIVMTFSQANTSLLASDFTIAGKTITLLERDITNKILTLTVSVAVAYGDSLIVTFVKTGGTAAVTNNVEESYPAVIDDGNTVGWFDYLENITKDGSNLVSVWGDKSGLAHNILQAAGTNQMLWSVNGVLADGLDNFMNAAFDYIQPVQIYICFRQKTWSANDRVFDGFTSGTGVLAQAPTTPKLALYRTIALYGDGLTLDTFGIVRVLYNGVNSSIEINELGAIVGNTGTVVPLDGFTLGSQGGGLSYWSNIEVKEIVLRKVADNATDKAAIYAYLAAKYGI